MEIVYNGSDNENIIEVSEKVGNVTTPVDLTGATGLELYLPFLDRTITTGIDYASPDGVIKFKLGDQNIPAGKTYLARLTVFDPLHPNGQILVHELSGSLLFRVVE